MNGFSCVRHDSSSPDVAQLIRILEDRGCSAIVIGSVAAAPHGVDPHAAFSTSYPTQPKRTLGDWWMR